MKRLSVTLFLCAIVAFSIARTTEQAAQVASGFLSGKHANVPTARRVQQAEASTTMPIAVEIAYTQKQVNSDKEAVYVFNGTDGGFVLVSAEDDTRAILGYSDEGKFDAINIPENMQFWLQMYASEIAYAQANKPTLKPGQVAIKRPQRVAASYTAVAPILDGVEWDQSTPFNNLCPIVNGGRSVTGCVATAMSQIMYAHKHPVKGRGSKSYTMTNGQTVSATFNVNYDWNNMLGKYSAGYTTTQANAVATLMYHAGVVAEMEYSPESSGANSIIAMQGLFTYLGYDKSIATNPKNYMKETDILTNIQKDLQAGMPVYMNGATKNNEGHAFVCDGMAENGYLHINWGWSGDANGYFSISALDPENQGIGGSSGDLAFTERVTAYTNIKPDQGGKGMPLVTVESLKRTSGDEINAPLIFSLEQFTSAGLVTAAGTLGYYIYDKNNTLVTTVGCTAFELDPMYYYTSATNLYAYIPQALENGDYELEIGYTDAAGEIHPVLVKNLGVVRIPMTVENGKITFGEIPEPGVTEHTQEITGIDAVNINGSTLWQLDLYSTYFWSDNESDDEVMIRLTLNSGSATSVIGTYVLDATNSGAVGTIYSDAMYAVGYYKACYQYTPSNLHLTIFADASGKLQVGYYVAVKKEEQSKTVGIAAPEWYYYSSSEEKYYYYDSYITYDLVSILSASEALNLTSRLTHTELTNMQYFVGGTITNMRNTPAEIAQNKSAQFDISKDSTKAELFYCNNTKWLNNTDFTTGKEIMLGDEVVLYGQLQNHMGNTPEIKGYVFSHKPIQRVDYSIKNLRITTNQDTVFFDFESEAPYFHVKVTKDDGTLAAEGIIDFKNVFVKLENGHYTLWIRPVDEAQKYYLADAIEVTFTISCTTAVDDIYHNGIIKVYDLMGRLVDQKQTNDNRPYNIPANGVYIQIFDDGRSEKIYINKQ